ncbi:O-antigen ligase [Rhizobium sp. RU20A]|uniref:O-antigen ligase family protein n=1 Tax=Rhizobium sp. RU20A TaxID=1907412 RepID=UPI00122D4BA2|nr:O-antigen ligase [Rhizobium sp. RU20A]
MAAVVSGFGLFIIIFTLTPFLGDIDTANAPADTANIINQVGYLSLALLFGFAILVTVERRHLGRLISPTWIVIFLLAYLSCLQSYDPQAAARGLTLSLVAMLIVVGLIAVPRSERDFVNAGATAVLALVLIDYAALVLLPAKAIHQGVGAEYWHAGFWRGHLIHKNVTAPIFSVIAMFGIYAFRAGARLRGSAIAVLAFIFVAHTGSKTTMGFLPVAILLVLAGRAIGSAAFTISCHVLFTILVGCLTIGTVFSPAFLHITAAILEDYTFTGRDAIWRFGSAAIADHPWLGHGFAGFWLSPVIMGMEANFEENWDVRGIVSGHNTYLDAIITFGLIGGPIIIALLFVKPLFDFAKATRYPANRAFADFCMMVIIFMTYNGMLESFIFNRADPQWLLTALAIFGLGMARHPDFRR